MAKVQITCINKEPRNNAFEGITHLGNANGKWTTEKVIGWIEDRSHSFYTLVQGDRGDIGVVNGANGKYVRTYSGGSWNDKLLTLPECI